MLCMVSGTLRAFNVNDSPLDNPLEICDLELELAVEMRVWLSMACPS